MKRLNILHFNDVYNIESLPGQQGGVARFATTMKNYAHLHPLVLFSGDALNPSLLSSFTQGEQMIPVLNKLNVQAAVFGNHEFDFGVDNLEQTVGKTHFPWLLSNVIDGLTDKPLANGAASVMIEWQGVMVGLVGLVEEEWMETLATLDPEDILFMDFVLEGNRLARDLKQHGADVVIALTHMRWPNDTKLAENSHEIDLILGGHDHDYGVMQVNGRYIIKSGTDFQNLSVLTMTLNDQGIQHLDVKRVDIPVNTPEDEEMKEIVSEYKDIIERKMETILGYMDVEMDGRSQEIRTHETNLGNFITDIMMSCTVADVALLNSGTFRSDKLHQRGPFTMGDLASILPLIDHLVVIQVNGATLLKALENGVSQYPKMEGRFPQISGIVFGFDPSRAPGKRVDADFVMVGDVKLRLNQLYRLVTKKYLTDGKDGFKMLKSCPLLANEEQCPILTTAVQNYFDAVKIFRGRKISKSGHRPSLISLQTRGHIIRNCEGCSVLGPPTRRKLQLVRQESIHDVEFEQSKLAPMVEGRIFFINDANRAAMRGSKLSSIVSIGESDDPPYVQQDPNEAFSVIVNKDEISS